MAMPWDTLSVRDVADDGVAVRIKNDGVSAAGNVNAACITVHVYIVPATIAADRNGFDDVVAAAGRRGGVRRARKLQQKR